MVCVSFYVICIVERLVSSVICRFQGLSYSHVPECIEFSFILFIHHYIHFYFELCTYCNIFDMYLSWNMNSVKYLFIWNYWIIYFVTCLEVFSAANLALAGFLLTNALGENLPSCHLNMFNLRLCNAVIIRYSLLKFGHMHLCGKDYKYFSPRCCKCNSFGCIAAIRWGNACYGPHSDSVYSGSEHL